MAVWAMDPIFTDKYDKGSSTWRNVSRHMKNSFGKLKVSSERLHSYNNPQWRALLTKRFVGHVRSVRAVSDIPHHTFHMETAENEDDEASDDDEVLPALPTCTNTISCAKGPHFHPNYVLSRRRRQKHGEEYVYRDTATVRCNSGKLQI